MNIKSVSKWISERSPEFLVGFGIASFVTSVVLTVKATLKAEDLIIQAEDEKEDKLTPIETVKAAWKPFVAPVIALATGAVCVAGGMKVKSDRHAELAAAYAISQGVIKKLDEKTEEVVGKEKADEIKKEVRREMENGPAAREAVSKLPSSNIAGVHPFLDPLSNTAFYANPQMLEKAEVRLNKRLFNGLETYVTVSDLYDELNEQGIYPKLRHTAVSPMLGWTADNGGIEFDFDVDGIPLEQGHWDDGTPCYIMGFKRYRGPDTLK